MARHRRWVGVAWLLIVFGAGYLNGVFNKSVSDNFRIPNAGSQDAYDLLQERFQSQNGATLRRRPSSTRSSLTLRRTRPRRTTS